MEERKRKGTVVEDGRGVGERRQELILEGWNMGHQRGKECGRKEGGLKGKSRVRKER